MASINDFLDSLRDDNITMRSFAHASRVFVDDGFKHAPKQKFLYHVIFFLTREAQTVIPELANYTNEIGVLVKNTDLPSYQAAVEVKNKYNRKKNIQTGIQYRDISIDFHDDNYGVTTALLEAYFKYYYADSKNSIESGAYGTRGIPFAEQDVEGDTTYKGEQFNRFRYGMDNDTPAKPFFDRIEIAQLARRTYTKYIIVNPLITDWSHDSVDYSDSMGIMQNSITINYENVLYERGSVATGPDGDPVGFGTPQNYDVTPGPLQSSVFDLLRNNETVISDWEQNNQPDPTVTERRNPASQLNLQQLVNNSANTSQLFANPTNQSRLNGTVIPDSSNSDVSTETTAAVNTPGPSDNQASDAEVSASSVETLAKGRFIRQRAPSGDTEAFVEAGREWESLPEPDKQPFLDQARQDLESETQ